MSRADLVAAARAAEGQDAARALDLWAEAARAEGSLNLPPAAPRPRAFGAPRRRVAVPDDLAAWAATAPADAVAALIDDLARLVDFRTGLQLQEALERRPGADKEALASCLSARLNWRAQNYEAALADAGRALDLAGDVDPPGGVAMRLELEAIRLRAAVILGREAAGLSEMVRRARPLAAERAELAALWRKDAARGLTLADRLALTDDPPPAAEVLAATLRADAGDLQVARGVAAGLALRAAVAGRAEPVEVMMAQAALAHRAGDLAGREEALGRYFAAHGLEPPAWSSGETRFDALATTPAEARPEGPLVTVAMTTFNAQATVELALRSLTAQSHRQLEILVVDDASTDGTRAVLARLAAEDGRIRVIDNATNVGTYVSKNRALAEAKGDWFTNLDADDWAHPRRIQRHLGTMLAHPELVATRSNWIRMTEDGEPALRRSLGVFTHANPASPFFRTEVVRREIGFYDRVRIDGDLEHWLRLTTRFGLKATARLRLPLTLGRLHAGSLTRLGVGAQDDETYSPVRSAYRAAALDWRRAALRNDGLFIAEHPPTRPFPAPAGMAVDA